MAGTRVERKSPMWFNIIVWAIILVGAAWVIGYLLHFYVNLFLAGWNAAS